MGSKNDFPLMQKSFEEIERSYQELLSENEILRQQSIETVKRHAEAIRLLTDSQENIRIAELKLAEIALEESEQKFSMSFLLSPAAITLTTPIEGKFIDVNETFLRELGYLKEEVIGQTIFELKMFIDQEDTEDLIKELLEKQFVTNREVRMRKKSGETLIALVSIVFIQLKGETVQLTFAINITERMLSDLNLKISEEKYRLLAENSADIIWMINPEGNYNYVSPSIEKLLGLNPRDILNKPAVSILPPSHRQNFEMQLKTTLERIGKGETDISSEIVEMEMKNKDGTSIWTETLVKPIFNQGDGFVGFFGITREISERKKAQLLTERHALEQNLLARISSRLVGVSSGEEAFKYIGKQIFDIAKRSFVILTKYDPEKNTMVVKSTFGAGHKFSDLKKTFGTEPLKRGMIINDIMLKDLEIYKLPGMHLIAQEGVKTILAHKISRNNGIAIEQALHIKEIYTIGISWDNKLFGCIWILSRGKLAHDEKLLIQTIVNQASMAIERLHTGAQLARSEKKYRTLVEMSPDGIGLLKSNGELISCNQELANIFGFKDETELMNEMGGAFDFIANKDKDRAVKNVRLMLEEKSSPVQVYSMVRKDGSEFQAEVKTVILHDEHSQSKMLLSIIRDITEQKLAEEALEKYNKKLRNFAAHNEMVREQERLSLARDIHDVLGSSLAGLKMELAVLMQMISADQKQSNPEIPVQIGSMYKQIDESVTIMRKMVRELRPGILDELGLIEAIRWYAGEIEKRSGITFMMKVQGVETELDVKKSIIIFRIFQEILTNIVLHAQADKVQIRISWPGKKFFQLKVADNGVGIKKDVAEKPDSFGLTGMKERALLLGGRFTISGKAGKGTQVFLEIPIIRFNKKS